jgi:hypothetical protein
MQDRVFPEAAGRAPSDGTVGTSQLLEHSNKIYSAEFRPTQGLGPPKRKECRNPPSFQSAKGVFSGVQFHDAQKSAVQVLAPSRSTNRRLAEEPATHYTYLVKNLHSM